jgi:hypothetical protein
MELSTAPRLRRSCLGGLHLGALEASSCCQTCMHEHMAVGRGARRGAAPALPAPGAAVAHVSYFDIQLNVISQPAKATVFAVVSKWCLLWLLQCVSQLRMSSTAGHRAS